MIPISSENVCLLIGSMHVPALEHDEVAVGQKESTDTVAPPEILKLSMVIIVVPSILVLHVTGQRYVSSKCCLESLSHIVSEAS